LTLIITFESLLNTPLNLMSYVEPPKRINDHNSGHQSSLNSIGDILLAFFQRLFISQPSPHR
ncbi:hypothetical protein, partial [Escherichia coli]|uniref:hypothetical protein n=1 Tax=Escherichia coli TaxID=562 RepID=UPI001BDDA361